jgi:TonB family protein
MFWRLCVLAVALSLARAADSSGPSEFSVVSVFFSDDGALLYYRLTEVKPDEAGSLIRYVRIAPANGLCARRIIVQAAEARVPDTPASLAKNNSPCAVNQSVFRSTVKKFSHRGGYLEAIGFGLAAKCGSSSVLFELADPSFIDPDRLRRSHPEMANLWDLNSQIVNRAFGANDIFHDRTENDDLGLQRAGEKIAPDLISGRYDAGLKAALRGIGITKTFGFRDVLSDYHGPVSAKEIEERFTPSLVNAQVYHFSAYAAPVYPPLAKQARIQGRVELQLSVEPSTGEIRDVKAVSGHQLLAPSALEAARHWRFTPDSVGSNSMTLALDYSLRCP